jgi:hypothetical protein
MIGIVLEELHLNYASTEKDIVVLVFDRTDGFFVSCSQNLRLNATVRRDIIRPTSDAGCRSHGPCLVMMLLVLVGARDAGSAIRQSPLSELGGC